MIKVLVLEVPDSNMSITYNKQAEKQNTEGKTLFQGQINSQSLQSCATKEGILVLRRGLTLKRMTEMVVIAKD